MTKSINISNNIGIEDQELSKNVGIEIIRVSHVINPNKYNKHNYYDMVNNCTHLTVKMKSKPTNLFKNIRISFLE